MRGMRAGVLGGCPKELRVRVLLELLLGICIDILSVPSAALWRFPCDGNRCISLLQKHLSSPFLPSMKKSAMDVHLSSAGPNSYLECEGRDDAEPFEADQPWVMDFGGFV